MKTISTTLWLFLSLSACGAIASVKCPEAKIQSVYQTEEKIFIQLEGQAWHVLAMKSDTDAQKKMARAMKAQKKDMKVELTFPNGYHDTCLASDTSVVAKKIKLVKKKKYKEEG